MVKSLKNKQDIETYARLLKNFYGELYSCVIVNAGLILIWLLTGAGYFWPIWPIVVWGISLLIKASKLEIIDHGFYEQCDALRERFLFLKKDWEEEKVQEMLDKFVTKAGESKKTGAVKTPMTAEKPLEKNILKKAPEKKPVSAKKSVPKKSVAVKKAATSKNVMPKKVSATKKVAPTDSTKK